MENRIYQAVRRRIFSKLFSDIELNVKYVSQEELLTGKSAVIIGGGSGIGAAIAHRLAEAGCKVVIAGRNEDKLKKVCATAGKKNMEYEVWDITDFSQMDEHLHELSLRLKKIDILVNSAGILTDADLKVDFHGVTMEDWDRVMDTNLKAVFFLCQKFAATMEETGGGHILNIASTEGLHGAKVPYGISKWGIVGLTEGLGKLLAPKGIIVNGIAPGATATGMLGRKEGNLVLTSLPGGRYSIPQEIANLALFMVSDMGNNMIGEVVRYDAGENLR